MESIARLECGKKGFLDEIFGVAPVAKLPKRVAVKIIAVRFQPSGWIELLLCVYGYRFQSSALRA